MNAANLMSSTLPQPQLVTATLPNGQTTTVVPQQFASSTPAQLTPDLLAALQAQLHQTSTLQPAAVQATATTGATQNLTEVVTSPAPVKITVTGKDTFDILKPITDTLESILKPLGAPVEAFLKSLFGSKDSQGIAQKTLEAGILGSINELHANQSVLDQGLINVSEAVANSAKTFSQAVKDGKFKLPKETAEQLISAIRKFPELLEAIAKELPVDAIDAFREGLESSLDMNKVLKRAQGHAQAAGNPKLVSFISKEIRDKAHDDLSSAGLAIGEGLEQKSSTPITPTLPDAIA